MVALKLEAAEQQAVVARQEAEAARQAEEREAEAARALEQKEAAAAEAALKEKMVRGIAILGSSSRSSCRTND